MLRDIVEQLCDKMRCKSARMRISVNFGRNEVPFWGRVKKICGRVKKICGLGLHLEVWWDA